MFSYYNISENNSLQLTSSSTPDSKRTLKASIEQKIKTKYKMTVPAISMEIKQDNNVTVEFNKEDLKNVRNVFYIYI
jgi:hypothetical protein